MLQQEAFFCLFPGTALIYRRDTSLMGTKPRTLT